MAKGVKGSGKVLGDPCGRCSDPLTEATIVPRRGKRAGAGAHSCCRLCLNARARAFQARFPERRRAGQRKHREMLRQKVFAAYGGKCACCGEARPQFLAIDHVAGGGNKHRRREKIFNPHMMRLFIVRAGFPSDFQLLCHNCNGAKGWYGECPHEAERRSAARSG